MEVGTIVFIAIAVFVAGYAIVIYNNLVGLKHAVSQAWSNIDVLLKQRHDELPKLVDTCKQYMKHERETLEAVVQARNQASGAIQAAAANPGDPAAMQGLMGAESALTGALGRLLVTVERYPELKSDQNFRDLQAQLEGTENRITVARQRYIQTVQDYNVIVRSFPTNLTAMIFGYKVKPNFTVENEAEISKPPAVDFTKPAGGTASSG